MPKVYELTPDLVVTCIRKLEEHVRRLFYEERMEEQIRNISLRLVKAAPSPAMWQEFDGMEGLIDAQIVFEYEVKERGKWEPISVLYQQIPVTRESYDINAEAALEAGRQVVEQIRIHHKEGKPLHFWGARTLCGEVEKVWVENDQFAFAYVLEDGTTELRSYPASFSASSSLRNVLQAVDPTFSLTTRIDLQSLIGKPFQVVTYTDKEGKRRLYEFLPSAA